MKRNAIAVLFFLVSLLLASCSKVDALFNNGEAITEQRSVGHKFSVVSMYNNVNVNLVQDNNPHLELTCPKNLIGKITTEVIDDTLIIMNRNDFNWLRNYDYNIDLTVYFDSLRSINYCSIGSLHSSDSLKGMMTQSIDSLDNVLDTIKTHNFILRIQEGSGDIDLNFDCQVLKTVFRNGTSKVTLHGSAGYTEHYLNSYGTIHAEDMYSNIVKVHSSSTNDIYVWAKTALYVKLSNIGNVYYKGSPWIEQQCTSDGRVIKLE